MLLQRLGWGWALLGGCMDTPCTDGLGSFFQPDQGPRSHPSALSSHPVMAHPSSTKQCCASPWIQCHHAQPSRAAGCTQQGKEGCSRAFLPPLLFLLQSPQHCSAAVATIPGLSLCRDSKPGGGGEARKEAAPCLLGPPLFLLSPRPQSSSAFHCGGIDIPSNPPLHPTAHAPVNTAGAPPAPHSHI